jgi:hypothetical protein
MKRTSIVILAFWAVTGSVSTHAGVVARLQFGW